MKPKSSVAMKTERPKQPVAQDTALTAIPAYAIKTAEGINLTVKGVQIPPLSDTEFDDLVEFLLAFQRQRQSPFKIILGIVACHYRLPVARLLDKSRDATAVLARHVAMAMCSEFFAQRSERIAQSFSRHHSLIRSAKKAILHHQKTPEGRAELDAIRTQIRSALKSD